MHQMLRWLDRSAWPIVFVCFGLVVGLVLKYPADWNPPDPTLNLLGGLVGSLGSVAAAFLVLQRQFAHDGDKEVKRERGVRRKIGRIFTVLLVEIQIGLQKSDGRRVVAVTELADKLAKLVPTLRKYEQVLPSQLEAWMSFDEECVMFFETTRVALQALVVNCEKLREQASLEPELPLPDDFKDSWEALIKDANELVDDVMEISGDHDLRRAKIDPRAGLGLVLKN